MRFAPHTPIQNAMYTYRIWEPKENCPRKKKNIEVEAQKNLGEPPCTCQPFSPSALGSMELPNGMRDCGMQEKRNAPFHLEGDDVSFL